MYSSRSTSPGCMGGNRKLLIVLLPCHSVVVGNLYFVSIPTMPSEADTKLIVNADRILADSIILQCMQPIARRGLEVLKLMRGLDHGQLPACGRQDGRWKAFGANAVEDGFRRRIRKAPDHFFPNNVSPCDTFFKPYVSLTDT